MFVDRLSIVAGNVQVRHLSWSAPLGWCCCVCRLLRVPPHTCHEIFPNFNCDRSMICTSCSIVGINADILGCQDPFFTMCAKEQECQEMCCIALEIP